MITCYQIPCQLLFTLLFTRKQQRCLSDHWIGHEECDHPLGGCRLADHPRRCLLYCKKRFWEVFWCSIFFTTFLLFFVQLINCLPDSLATGSRTCKKAINFCCFPCFQRFTTSPTLLPFQHWKQAKSRWAAQLIQTHKATLKAEQFFSSLCRQFYR